MLYTFGSFNATDQYPVPVHIEFDDFVTHLLKTRRRLTSLSEMGFRVALDDLGAG